jgi:galactonate dehydratase
MKIWPLDPYAEQSGGAYIGRDDLQRGLEPFRKIREAVGDRIEIMVELHGLWNATTAREIIAALEDFDPYWIEDPIRPDDAESLARLARATPARIAVGETLAGFHSFRALLDREAWAGGVTAARKVAGLAEAYGVPIAFHDCIGPVVLSVGTHLAHATASAPMQETVRAYYTGWYRELVTSLPRIEHGAISAPESPGHGIALAPGIRGRPDAVIVTSRSGESGLRVAPAENYAYGQGVSTDDPGRGAA